MDDDIYVLGLLQRAISKRCYLTIKSPRAPSYIGWLSGLSRARREAWDVQLAWAVRDRAAHRIRHFEIAATPESDWTATPPRLTLADALTLIDTPFRIMLENGRGDRAFLLSMATPAQRRLLEHLEATDRLIFQGGGGIGELRTVINEQISSKPHRHLTHWVLFDSDAPAPGTPSHEANLTSAACHTAKIPFHSLERRAIENYLPKWALYFWAESSVGREARTRRRLIDTFFRMNADQRHHFHMKAGFTANPQPAEAALFATVTGADRATLASGIGKKVADVFANADKDKLRYHIENDGCAAELATSLAALVEILRVPYG